MLAVSVRDSAPGEDVLVIYLSPFGCVLPLINAPRFRRNSLNASVFQLSSGVIYVLPKDGFFFPLPCKQLHGPPALHSVPLSHCPSPAAVPLRGQVSPSFAAAAFLPSPETTSGMACHAFRPCSFS
eukprot:EG_transcript_42035